MKRTLVRLCCVSSVAMGCGDLPSSENKGLSPAVSAGSAGLSYTDPETGVVYIMNPNRRVVSGGGAATQTRQLPDGTTEIQSAIVATGFESDWSGRIQTQTVECQYGPITGSFGGGLLCGVAPDQVLIGGGAQDVWTTPGALLYWSEPDGRFFHGQGGFPDQGGFWVAGSKDHLNTASHTLRIWAVGLKLKRADGSFMTYDEVKSHISYSETSSPGTRFHNPSATCTVPTGQLVIGGGVVAFGSSGSPGGDPGQLLTQSFPSSDSSWYGASKDHIASDPGSVNVSCIGIDRTIPGFGSIEVFRSNRSGTVSTGVGSPTVTLAVSPRAVPTCYGGEAGWDGVGRMLFRMSPGDSSIFDVSSGLRSATAGSKDHLQADSGTTIAWISAMRLAQ
jgi:hypothetical protein